MFYGGKLTTKFTEVCTKFTKEYTVKENFEFSV